jgi:hypothetical protein
MTESDIRRIKADLLLESREVEDSRQISKEAILQAGSALEKLGKRLQTPQLKIAELSERDLLAMNVRRLADLITEFNELSEKSEELHERRKQVGV